MVIKVISVLAQSGGGAVLREKRSVDQPLVDIKLNQLIW